jgi:hypothetical protein
MVNEILNSKRIFSTPRIAFGGIKIFRVILKGMSVLKNNALNSLLPKKVYALFRERKHFLKTLVPLQRQSLSSKLTPIT